MRWPSRRGPGPCPGCRPPAGRRRPPRARGRTRCRRRSRSTVSSGSPRRPTLGQRVLPVAPEEVPVQPGRDVVPGQGLVLGPVAVAHLLEAQALGGQRLLPQREVEVLGPLLERAAGPPDPLDHRAHPPVAPAGQALGHRGRRVVPADGQARGRAGPRSRSSATLRSQLGHGVLPEPLERRVRLGHEAADRGDHRDRLVVAPADLDAAARPARRCRARPRRSRWAGR